MREKLLSVIIPVYNVEKYLKRCVDSVLNQKYRNLQIILVDDGSTDSSGKICDEFLIKDDRINVIHKDNGGLSSARNIGLDNAKGELITFLDSDDYVDASMYNELIEILEKNSCDIAACAVQEVDEEYKIQTRKTFDNSLSFLTREEVIEDLYKQEKVRFEVWNKVYTKEVLEDVRFIKGQIYEDVNFDRLVFQKIKKYAFLNKPLHFYLTKRPGNTNSRFSEKKLNIFHELDKFIKDIETMGLPMRVRDKFEAIKVNFCIGLSLAAKQHKADRQTRQFLRKKFKELKVNNRNNNYISRKAVWLFSFSPFLYAFILKMRSKGE